MTDHVLGDEPSRSPGPTLQNPALRFFIDSDTRTPLTGMAFPVTHGAVIHNTPSHRESASRVGPILDLYIQLLGCEPADNTHDISMYVDLVADILHLAASRGVDYEQILPSARMHFEAEAITPDDLAMIVTPHRW